MARKFEVQDIATASTKTEVTVSYDNYNSISLANTHATADVTLDLYLTDQTGTYITATDVVAAETEAASTSSVTLTVDDGSGSASDAANDELLNERVYKSDGTLFGTCTTVSSTTSLVFSGGLSSAITNNNVLYTGTRFHLLNNVIIPNGATLKLEGDEFNFDRGNYKLYIFQNQTLGIKIILR